VCLCEGMECVCVWVCVSMRAWSVCCECMGVYGCVSGKNLSANAGSTRDAGLIPGLERSPGEGNGSLL